jgi:hypothetical protein
VQVSETKRAREQVSRFREKREFPRGVAVQSSVNSREVLSPQLINRHVAPVHPGIAAVSKCVDAMAFCAALSDRYICESAAVDNSDNCIFAAC